MSRFVDCKKFREQHALFVDQRCTAHEEDEMREHLHECPACSRHDTIVRRSLMLVRSLPTIEPSADFRARLDARLREVSPLAARRPWITYVPLVAAAASLAFVAGLAAHAWHDARGTSQIASMPIRLAPVVATLPEFEPAPVASTALVATVPTGMSVWPAIMVASQTPSYFVAAEMATER